MNKSNDCLWFCKANALFSFQQKNMWLKKKVILCNSNLANDVFRKNNKSSIILISYINWTLLITIMDLKVEAWNLKPEISFSVMTNKCDGQTRRDMIRPTWCLEKCALEKCLFHSPTDYLPDKALHSYWGQNKRSQKRVKIEK